MTEEDKPETTRQMYPALLQSHTGIICFKWNFTLISLMVFLSRSWQGRKPQSCHFTLPPLPVNQLPQKGLSHVRPPPLAYKEVVLMVAFTDVICSLPLYLSTGGLGVADWWCLSSNLGLWLKVVSVALAAAGRDFTCGISSVLQTSHWDATKSDLELPLRRLIAWRTNFVPTSVTQL